MLNIYVNATFGNDFEINNKYAQFMAGMVWWIQTIFTIQFIHWFVGEEENNSLTRFLFGTILIKIELF